MTGVEVGAVAPAFEGVSVPAAGFDVRAFARSAAGSHRRDLDLESFRVRPLSPGALGAVSALALLERRTTYRLRAMLVTPTHKDARVTAFLATWAYEKHWLADALRAVLEQREGARDVPGAPAVMWRQLASRVAPIGGAVVSNAIGTSVVALHMSAGALDDLIVQGAYRGLAAREGHPGLSAALDLLLAVKSRHQEFFSLQARDRLAASRGTRVLVRARLRGQDMPIGRHALSATQRLALAGTLTHGEPASVDTGLDALPGLRGLRTGSRAAAWLAATR